jgi:hypothetical protein
MFGQRMADTIQPSEIAEWFDEMEDERDWSNAAIKRYRAAMSKAYKLAIADGKVTRNPVKLVPQRPEANRRLRFLSLDEEKRLRVVIKRDCYVRQFDIALNIGIRKGEQFSITADQIDFDQKYVYLSLMSARMRALPSFGIQPILVCSGSGNSWGSIDIAKGGDGRRQRPRRAHLGNLARSDDGPSDLRVDEGVRRSILILTLDWLIASYRPAGSRASTLRARSVRPWHDRP